MSVTVPKRGSNKQNFQVTLGTDSEENCEKLKKENQSCSGSLSQKRIYSLFLAAVTIDALNFSQKCAITYLDQYETS